MTAMILLSEWERSQIEFWKPIQGFPGYDVSSKGQVRSWWVRVMVKHKSALYEIGTAPTLKSQSLNKDGYPRVTLWSRDKKKHVTTVHLLVARTFIPNPNHWPQVNHLNGYAKTDNHVRNLEWATQFRQARHAYETGLNTPRTGTLNGMSKLTDDDVREIRKTAVRRQRIGNGRLLAEKYGVSKTVINKVARGITYKNVQ